MKISQKAIVLSAAILLAFMLLTPQVTIANTGAGTDWENKINTWTHNAWGRFTSASGTFTESDNKYGPDSFSLQLNTNQIPITITGTGCPHSSCPTTGWEQFVFANQGNNLGKIVVDELYLGYYTAYSRCPPNFSSDGFGNCVNAQYSLFYGYVAAAIPRLNVSGAVTTSGDWATVCDTYQNVCANSPKEADYIGFATNNLWQISEFNVFGYGDQSQAQFKATMTLSVETYNAHISGLACNPGGLSAESTNLNLGSCSVNAPKLAIDFSESH